MSLLDHSAAPAGPATPVPGTVADALDMLEVALRHLAGADLSSLGAHESGQAVLRLTRARNALDGVDAAVADRFSTGGVWGIEGFRSPAAWLCARTTEATGAVYGRLRTAATARKHPVLAEELRAGRISTRHLVVVAEAHRRYPVLSPALHGIEPQLAAYAVQATPEDLRRRLAATLHRIDPDAVDNADARRRDTDAGLHHTPLLDGWGKVDALLPPEIYAKLRTVLDAARTALRREKPNPAADGPAADGNPTGGNGPAGGPAAGNAAAAGNAGDRDAAGDQTPAWDDGPLADLDPGPRRARQLAAFDRVLDAALAATGTDRLPDLGGTRPVVTIVIPVDTALTDPPTGTSSGDGFGTNDGLGPDRGSRADADDGPQPPGPAWLDRTGALLTPRTLHRLLCDASVRRLLVDPRGLPLDLGRTTRTITTPLRAAVAARDRHHCRFPGCRHRLDQIHHVIPWTAGGPTDQANLAGLCWQHHHTVHEPGWTITGNADHELTFTRTHLPRGTWTSPAPGVGC